MENQVSSHTITDKEKYIVEEQPTYKDITFDDLENIIPPDEIIDEDAHRVEHFFEVEGERESERILSAMDNDTLKALKEEIKGQSSEIGRSLYNLVIIELCERVRNGEI